MSSIPHRKEGFLRKSKIGSAVDGPIRFIVLDKGVLYVFENKGGVEILTVRFWCLERNELL